MFVDFAGDDKVLLAALKDFAEKGEVDPGDPFADFNDKGKDE